MVLVPSASEFAQEKGDSTLTDFYPPAASGVSTVCKGSDIRMIGINSRKGV
jgi:hypothetical protein